MGLDMYLYKFTKPTTEEIAALQNTDYDDVPDNFFVLNKEFYESPMHSDVIPYCQEVNLLFHYIDVNKVIELYDMPKDVEINGLMSDENGLFYYFTAENYERKVLITDDLIRTLVEPAYIAKKEEVFYWRNAEDIQSEFYKCLSHVENCGYYKTTPKMLTQIWKKFRTVHPCPTANGENEAIFYHEWY